MMWLFTNVFLWNLLAAAAFEPCPSWSNWTESSVCAMPTDLPDLVQRQCPLENSDQNLPLEQSPFARFRTRFRCFLKNTFNGRCQDCRCGNGNNGQRRPAISLLLKPWASIYTKCGSCGIAVRCRTRKPAFACSPTLEVERAPCNDAEMKPACQLAPQECALINKTLLDSPEDNKLLQRKKKHGNENWYRNRKLDHYRRDRSHRHYLHNAWVNVSHFESELSQLSNRVVVGQMMSQSQDATTTLPGFNCKRSRQGCFCCCKPFVPVDGICQQLDEELHSTTQYPKESTDTETRSTTVVAVESGSSIANNAVSTSVQSQNDATGPVTVEPTSTIKNNADDKKQSNSSETTTLEFAVTDATKISTEKPLTTTAEATTEEPLTTAVEAKTGFIPIDTTTSVLPEKLELELSTSASSATTVSRRLENEEQEGGIIISALSINPIEVTIAWDAATTISGALDNGGSNDAKMPDNSATEKEQGNALIEEPLLPETENEFSQAPEQPPKKPVIVEVQR